ncbi:MAG TPA: HEAT repeat domain-containing protein [Phycisphaerae bacterium]|nr:HEAT repeat domain-containing protein [Phycisphaerae bacterium]
MAKRPKILDILARIDDPVADEAMVAGILYVDADLQTEIVDLLLSRGHDLGLAALPQLYDKLEEDSQRRIVGQTAQLFSAMRSCVRGPDVQTRLNTLRIIRDSKNLRLAYLVALAMHDGAAKVRAEAATTLLALSEYHDATYAETTAALRESADDEDLAQPIVATLQMLREERQFLFAALRESLESYESHHRPEVLAAAMAHADELEDSLFKNSTLKRGKLTHAMLEILAGTLVVNSAIRSGAANSRYVPFLYVALRYPELRRRVMNHISTNSDPEFFVEFIRCGWLARDPGNRRHLSAVRLLTWLGDGFEPAFTLPPEIAAKLPGWLLAFGLPSDQKVAILLNLLLIDNLEANRAALWALTQIQTPSASLALQGAADHEAESVRRMAQFEIAHRRRMEERHVHHARKDRPAEWAQLLERAGISEEFDDLWRNFEGLQPAQAQLAGQFAPEYVEGLNLHVQNKMLDAQPAERLRAVRFVTTLRIVDRFRKDLFSLANDPMAEVRATVMKALAGIGEATSRRILERGLGDDSPAVQAAAIEALDALGALRRNPDRLLPKTESEDAAVRAAAIRALLKMHVPKSAVALVMMLQDPRVEHRCTALWIIDQMRLSAIAPRVQTLAENDQDPRIARTAQQVLRRLVQRPSPAPAARPVEVPA